MRLKQNHDNPNLSQNYYYYIEAETRKIKDIALEVLISSPTFLKYLTNESSHKIALERLKQTQEVVENQTEKLEGAFESVKHDIEDIT